MPDDKEFEERLRLKNENPLNIIGTNASTITAAQPKPPLTLTQVLQQYPGLRGC